MNDHADYYDVLGVPRNATAEDIRRAYRRMAREHHPDLNPNDASASERLKRINAAYEVLRDPRKRSAYDRFGEAGVASAAGRAAYGDFPDIGDLFESFFGFGSSRGRGARVADRPVRGDDLRATVHLTFEEAVFGTTTEVTVRRREACPTCDGSGAAPGSRAVQCSACNGRGEVRRVRQSVFGSFVNIQPCGECRGRGEKPGSACPDCGGARRQEGHRTLEVDIPAGVEGGMQVRLAGEGDHGINGGPPGDLYVALDVADHEVFQRQGFDVHLEMWVNPADAALGAAVEVPTLEGAAPASLPPGTQTGDTVTLPGLGVPHLKRRGRGDQVVTFFVRTPEKLTRRQRELLAELRGTLPPAKVAPRHASLWDRLRGKLP